ncbi:chromate transporter [Glaciimonas immobilis]|uniref:Chromate transporter n=1 Tax=Glaciimonas immobilis TaxID=728004 RepID=A0A840RYP2_9BURK|nr:chromate transporter [Glaciimonas immobilis]KAF3996093.1 chromate transporter [Glaciimonas immobilis]MBB5201764.1 chromate transporter [Glaciimonas immobilis]
MSAILLSLAAIFSQLSLLAFGGGNTILPEMQRQVVDLHHWMTAREFSAMFALAQAAPGPNMMVVTLVGWHVAGWQGVLVTSIAKFGPSSILTGIALHYWTRFKDARWRSVVQAGLVPVTVGLVAASAALITQASVHTWILGAITFLCALGTMRSRVHPLWFLAAGALIGLSGVGQ